jgi:hypothetical protein
MSHPELVAARRSIALGKITAFSRECWRLAELVEAGALDLADVVDALAEADVTNDLSITYGADLVQSTISNAFADNAYGARIAEIAA